jgi:murein L,D-transpeptidase YcbB/YkuD
MLYYTVWVGEDGKIIYGNDLYNYDQKTIERLQAIDGIYVPVDNGRAGGG